MSGKKKSRSAEHFKKKRSLLREASEERYEEDMTELESLSEEIACRSLFV